MLSTECGPYRLPGLEAAEQMFQPDVLDAALADAIPRPWRCYGEWSWVDESDLPREESRPYLMVIGSDDAVISVEQQVARMEDLCDAGYVVELIECAGADHVGAQVDAGGYALQWLRDRRAGMPITAETCVHGEPVDCTTL